MGVRVHVVPLGWIGSLPPLARGVLGDRWPFQVLLYARRRARARVARLVAGADVVHAQLLRTLAYLPVRRPPALVVDLIDALSVNLARRAESQRGPLALLAAVEAARLRRAEAEGLDWSTEVMIWAFGVSLFAHVVSFWGTSYFDQTVVLWHFTLAMLASLNLFTKSEELKAEATEETEDTDATELQNPLPAN